MAKHFQKGDRVFAKVRGYPPWPARIEEIQYNDSGRSKFLVTFYGTYESSLCKVDDLFHYSEYKEEYGKPMKRKGFNEALIQIDNNSTLPTLMPKNVKKRGNNQSSDRVESINRNIGKKKVTFKRKRDRSTKSPFNNSTTPNSQIEEPPRKRLKVSPNDNLSNAIKTQVISRSGRRIKQRKFSDDVLDDSTDSKCLSGIPSNAVRKKRSIRNVVESETSTPKHSSKNNANSINTKRSSECEQTQTVIKMDRLTWFKNEVSLLELENTVRFHLTVNSANTEKAIEALQQLNALSLHPLMLKKYPRIVRTINRLRRYVGNVETWKFSEEQQMEFDEEAKSIRSEADSVYRKFKALFTIPEGFTFSKFLQDKVSEFKKLTSSLSHEEICTLTEDPKCEHGEIAIETNEENSQKQITIPEGFTFSNFLQDKVSEFKKLTSSLSHEEICTLTEDPKCEHGEIAIETNEENSQKQITIERNSLDDPYSQTLKQNISLCDVIKDPSSATYVDPKVDSTCEGKDVTHCWQG